MNGSKPSDSETPLSISLSRRRRELLLEEIAAPDHLMRSVRVAQVERGLFHVRFTLDQLDELLDYIEDQARGTDNKRLQKEMYDLCEYMEQFGLRKIVDMENFRYHSSDFKQAQGHSGDGTTKQALGRNSSVGEEPFFSDASDQTPRPQDFNQMFLKILEHHGRIPRPEIGGLSWERFLILLQAPWDDENGPIRFNKTLKLNELQNAEILHRARIFLSEVVDSNCVKATVAGNLSRKFVGLMLDHMTWPDGYIEHLHRMNKVINEQDVFPLHIIRIITNLSGLLVLKKGVFSASKKSKQLLSEDRAGLLYHLLFQTLFQKIKLSYLDRMPEMSSFQETLLYSLFILSKTNMGWKRTDDIAHELLLPPVRLEMENTRCPSHWYLSSRFLSPLKDFGLLEIRKLPRDNALPGLEEVRKTKLFDRFVSFHLD